MEPAAHGTAARSRANGGPTFWDRLVTPVTPPTYVVRVGQAERIELRESPDGFRSASAVGAPGGEVEGPVTLRAAP